MSPLSRAKELTKKLHELGTQIESKETDEIRDELDQIWLNLTNEECSKLGKFSMALNEKNKSLYTENFAQTNLGNILAHESKEAIKDLVAEYMEIGYSPHEIEKVICTSIHLHVCRVIIDLRRVNHKSEP